MATYYGVYSTQAKSSSMSGQISKLWHNPLMMVYDKYVVPSGGISAGSDIVMGTIPKGARVVGFIFQGDDNGSTSATGTIYLGTTAATASGAITDLASGPVALFIPALDTFSQTPLTSNTAVSIKTATGALLSGVVLTLTTLYVMD
ncbi:MAG TPA: hypothetical protein PK052_07430 [Anaerohalosphaeraceae bacterium]|nr:hypothetical protein [Anaerohalosphaeraceae bacterium]